MGANGRRFNIGSNGGQRRVIVSSVPTKSLNQRHVTVSTKDLTLDARFTIAAELRNQAANRQSKGREAVLAKKRGLPGPNKTAKQGNKAEGSRKAEGKGKSRKPKGKSVLGGVRTRPTAPVRAVLSGGKGEKGGKRGSGKGRGKKQK